jgi:hypothetical protein
LLQHILMLRQFIESLSPDAMDNRVRGASLMSQRGCMHDPKEPRWCITAAEQYLSVIGAQLS